MTANCKYFYHTHTVEIQSKFNFSHTVDLEQYGDWGTDSLVICCCSVTKLCLWRSAFFMFQLSHQFMTTGKTITLTIWTSVTEVMSLLFNILSRLVIAFLPRNKHLLISWLQSLSVVILESKKRKSVTASTFSSSICHEVMGPYAMIFVF